MKKWLLYLMICLAVVGCSDDGPDSIPAPQEVTGFQWTRAEDVETRQQFLRNFGLGYSYDAVRGSYCDWQDIRCQVLNRYYVEQMGGVLHTTTDESSIINSRFEYSLRDYVANITITTTEEVDIGLYNGEKRSRQQFVEDGIEETFYFTHEEKHILAQSYLSYASLLAAYEDDPDEHQHVFTKSFVGAIKHLEETYEDNFAAVDSFLNVYGTHVIVSATMGGCLNIDLMNYLWRYHDQAITDELTSEEFLSMVEEKQSHSSSEEYQWIEQARLNITATGGDQSTLTGILGEYRADGTRQFSTDGIDTWRRSLTYDADNEQNANVELVDMKVVPIWEFAEAIDPSVAMRIKAAVLQDAALQQSLLGEVNFFDTAFPIRYDQLSCYYRNLQGGWSQLTAYDSDETPMVVNIVSGGRHVATVCHETIAGRRMWVCYPIYEGKVKLACGLGVGDDNTVYKVSWLNGKVTIKQRNDLAVGNMFYITGGGVRLVPTEGVNYAEAYAMPYIETGGGVLPDGTYTGVGCYPVVKQGEQFCFYSDVEDLPAVGWTRDASTSSPFRYVRNANYTYIYNPNEIKTAP